MAKSRKAGARSRISSRVAKGRTGSRAGAGRGSRSQSGRGHEQQSQSSSSQDDKFENQNRGSSRASRGAYESYDDEDVDAGGRQQSNAGDGSSRLSGSHDRQQDQSRLEEDWGATQDQRGMGSQPRSQGFGAGSQGGSEDEDVYEDAGRARSERSQDVDNDQRFQQQNMPSRNESGEDYGRSDRTGRGTQGGSGRRNR